MVGAPKGHGKALEVPQDGLEGTEPLATQDHLAAAQWDMNMSMTNRSEPMEMGTAGQNPVQAMRSLLVTPTVRPGRGRGSRPRRCAVAVATKQCVDPESTSARMWVFASVTPRCIVVEEEIPVMA